ncbi:hypothetical protein HAX54_043673, partial [Datura stramonium]|nr:hypothetical protein [Datura stramonium]
DAIELNHDLKDKHIARVKIKAGHAKVGDRENQAQIVSLHVGFVSRGLISVFSSVPRRGVKNLAQETSKPAHWLREMELQLRDSLCATLSVDYAELWEKLVIEVYRKGSLSTRITMTSEPTLATKCG